MPFMGRGGRPGVLAGLLRAKVNSDIEVRELRLGGPREAQDMGRDGKHPRHFARALAGLRRIAGVARTRPGPLAHRPERPRDRRCPPR